LKKELSTKYASTLKGQMAENETSKKTTLAKMNENETLLNKQLLDELENLRINRADVKGE